MKKETISVYDQGLVRLDVWLHLNFPDASRSLLARLIREGRVTLNGHPVLKPSKKVMNGDRIEITWPVNSDLFSPPPEDIPLNVLYQDDQLLVIYKQAGIAVHPVSPLEGGTLVNSLLFHQIKLPYYGLPLRPGIVHRLDKDTSGVMVVAKTERAYLHLVEEFKRRKVKKTYLAIVEGSWEEGEWIDLALGRDRENPRLMSFNAKKLRPALTRVEVLRRGKKFSLLALFPKTGRTHQLRVHLSACGHPIAGDHSYGSTFGLSYFSRQALHAFCLTLNHPLTGRPLTVCAALPQDMREFIEHCFNF